MKKVVFLLFPFLLLAETSFITPLEYAAQLYKNPRGIGCQHCHGEKGEGKLIAKYIHKDEERTFSAPAINKLDFKTFHKELSRRKNGMPRYFLTLKEIEALYLYVNEEKRKIEENKK